MSKIVYTKTQVAAWVFFFYYIGRGTRPENNTKAKIRKKACYINLQVISSILELPLIHFNTILTEK